jgi:hypothetical protein
MACLALDRGDDARALGLVRQALRLARDSGSGERMSWSVATAARALYNRARSREAASLVGAVEAAVEQLPRRAEEWRAGSKALALVASAALDEHRVAGRSLSLERAADLALRVLDEELALVAAAGAGRSEAAGEALSISSRGGRSQAFRDR